ncbi:MAG: DNA double-strand break repair nuclease NurA [Nitrososphaeria archaeon]|nr:DNA double-strand break repair nuclease NurA [Conexivisphaerales archaeon]
MISEVYAFINENRESMLRKIREDEEMAIKVKEMWNEQKIEDLSAFFAGIDSSWNSTRHHGFFFYVVDAVAVDSSGKNVATPKYIADIDTPTTSENGQIAYNTQRYLQSIGMDFEYELAVEASEKGYMTLIDNSALALIYDRNHKKEKAFIEYAKDLINRGNVIFIAKTSETKNDFNGSVGDIYYYSKYTSKAGISRVRYDPHGVSVFYARLADWAPVIKVEVPGEINEPEALKVVRMLHSVSINGYPYPLLLAHKICKITDEDMKTAETLLGLGAEPSAREVLWE